MKFASDILTHFVGRAHRDDPDKLVDICECILKDGFMFTEQRLDLGSGTGAISLQSSLEAVCFTDIPLRLADAHVARYGRCAIGVSKPRVKTWGGNPVLYIVDTKEHHEEGARDNFRGIFGENITATLRLLADGKRSQRALADPNHWLNALSDKQLDQMRRDLSWTLASHLKNVFDLGRDVDGEDDLARRDRYYMEREWRVCLWDAHRQCAENSSGTVTAKDQHYYLPVKPQDVKVIVLPNKSSCTKLQDRLLATGWTRADLPPMIVYSDSLDL